MLGRELTSADLARAAAFRARRVLRAWRATMLDARARSLVVASQQLPRSSLAGSSGAIWGSHAVPHPTSQAFATRGDTRPSGYYQPSQSSAAVPAAPRHGWLHNPMWAAGNGHAQRGAGATEGSRQSKRRRVVEGPSVDQEARVPRGGWWGHVDG